MLTLLKTIWAIPLVRKAVIYAVAGAAIFWCLRLWSNRVYSEGYKSGKDAGWTAARQQKEAEWKAKDAAIAKQAAKAAEDSKAVDTKRAQLAADEAASRAARKKNDAALSEALAEIRAGREVDRAQARNVPADRLADTVRAVSAELATAASPVK